jgi:chromosome segregation ATPase
MKKLLVAGITSLVLFILSVSAFYFWQEKSRSHAERGNEKIVDAASKAVPASKETAKHASNRDAEEIARTTNELRSRLASVREREDQLAARKRMIELIQADIRGERTALDVLRSQIKSELEALNEAVEGVEKQHDSLDEERQKISKTP